MEVLAKWSKVLFWFIFQNGDKDKGNKNYRQSMSSTKPSPPGYGGTKERQKFDRAGWSNTAASFSCFLTALMWQALCNYPL